MRRSLLPMILGLLLTGTLACMGGGGGDAVDSEGEGDTEATGSVYIDRIGGDCEGSTVTFEADTDGPVTNMTVEVYDGADLVGATALSERNEGNWIVEESTSTFGYSDCAELKLNGYLVFLAEGAAGQSDESATDATIL